MQRISSFFLHFVIVSLYTNHHTLYFHALLSLPCQTNQIVNVVVIIVLVFVITISFIIVVVSMMELESNECQGSYTSLRNIYTVHPDTISVLLGFLSSTKAIYRRYLLYLCFTIYNTIIRLLMNL